MHMTSNLFAALFAVLLTATLFQQAIVVPTAPTVPVAAIELA